MADTKTQPALTGAQLNWLNECGDLQQEFEAEAARQAKKQEFFDTQIQAELDRNRERIREGQSFTLRYDEPQRILFWQRTKTRTEKSMRRTRDDELDTVADMPGANSLNLSSIHKVLDAHRELVLLQQKMEQAQDESQKRLFTDREIMNELWTPLIRGGVVPSNAVTDRFSQEHQVFEGACEIYAEKLKNYTEQSTGNEPYLRALGIAKHTIGLLGSFAGESIKAANFEALSVGREELGNLRKQADAGDQDAQNRLDELKHMDRVLENQQGYATMGVALLNGGIAVAEAKLKKSTKSIIAEAAASAVAESILAGVGAITGTARGIDEAATDQKTKDLVQNVRVGTRAALAGVKVGLTFTEILETPEDKTTKAKALFHSTVTNLAKAVGAALEANDIPAGADPESEPGTGGRWKRIGNAVELGIISAANVGKGIEALANKDYKALTVALGVTVIGDIMSGTYEISADSVRKNVELNEAEGSSPFTETLDSASGTRGEQSIRNLKVLDEVNRLGGIQAAIGDAIRVTPKDRKNIDAQRQAAIQLHIEQEAREQRLQQLKAGFGQEAIEELLQHVDDDCAVLQKLMSEAKPPPENLEDPQKANRAIAALDKLMAEIESTRAKWHLLESITKGGTALLTSFLPVAGLAGAVSELVIDTAKLLKRSLELNLWLKNLALTAGNSSVYGPAIQSRCASATIQVSYQAARVVFDLVGITVESLKLADTQGAATGIAIANNMAKALFEFGYKMQKEAAIEIGWQVYKDARANPGNRKKARNAMTWNSTLSKCVLAYGIVVDKDPIAEQVARNCGLTPEILANDKDVAQRVVNYFETLYNDDPAILKAVPVKRDWHPGKPELTLKSWLMFKCAASKQAAPQLAEANTSDIDTAFSRLHQVCKGGPSYAKQRDEFNVEDPANPEYDAFLDICENTLGLLNEQFEAYFPTVSSADESFAGNPHYEMIEVCESFKAQAQLLLNQVSFDKKMRNRIKTESGTSQTELAEDESIDLDDLE